MKQDFNKLTLINSIKKNDIKYMNRKYSMEKEDKKRNSNNYRIKEEAKHKENSLPKKISNEKIKFKDMNLEYTKRIAQLHRKLMNHIKARIRRKNS